eukprot:Clim_evm149s157 gene=Clim_evmTU149s157
MNKRSAIVSNNRPSTPTRLNAIREGIRAEEKEFAKYATSLIDQYKAVGANTFHMEYNLEETLSHTKKEDALNPKLRSATFARLGFVQDVSPDIEYDGPTGPEIYQPESDEELKEEGRQLAESWNVPSKEHLRAARAAAEAKVDDVPGNECAIDETPIAEDYEGTEIAVSATGAEGVKPQVSPAPDEEIYHAEEHVTVAENDPPSEESSLVVDEHVASEGGALLPATN